MSKENIVDLLRHLVAIPSVNPGFTDAPAEYTGEKRLALYLMQWAKERNIHAEYFEAAPDRPCVLLESTAENIPAILLSAHMDTVWSADMESPFALKEKDGLLFGLGAADDKGPLAAALHALEKVNGKDLKFKFQVLASCDEEYGLCGIKKMIPEELSPALHIVAEPTSLQVVTAEKGSARFTVKVNGRKAHSSVPHLGENAIIKAVKLINALEEYSSQLQKRTPHPLLGNATLCIGTIRGGNQPSNVPDECVFSFNYRILPGTTPENLRSELENVLQNTGIDFELSAIFDAPPVETDGDNCFVQKMCRILQKNSLDPQIYGVPYASEAFQSAKYGIPVFIFGAGNIDCAHSDHEYISTGELLQMSECLEALLCE